VQEQISLSQNLTSVLENFLSVLTAESLCRIVCTNEPETILSGRGFTTPSRAYSSSTGPVNALTNSENEEYRYILFVWDGIEASSLTKANALAKAIELQSLFNKAKDAVLKVLFSGGVIRGKKL